MSILKSQLDHNNNINQLPDQNHNAFHPLTFMVSQENDDVLCYPQAMKSDDSDLFKEAMEEEMNSFKDEKIFKLIPIYGKP